MHAIKWMYVIYVNSYTFIECACNWCIIHYCYLLLLMWLLLVSCCCYPNIFMVIILNWDLVFSSAPNGGRTQWCACYIIHPIQFVSRAASIYFYDDGWFLNYSGHRVRLQFGILIILRTHEANLIMDNERGGISIDCTIYAHHAMCGARRPHRLCMIQNRLLLHETTEQCAPNVLIFRKRPN